jgi:hypothetical protein
MTLLKNSLVSSLRKNINEKDYNEILEAVYKRELSPSQAVDKLIGKFLK